MAVFNYRESTGVSSRKHLQICVLARLWKTSERNLFFTASERHEQAEWWKQRFEKSAAFDLVIWQLHLYINKNAAKMHSNHSD